MALLQREMNLNPADHPISGCLAASVTPFEKGGDRIDEAAFQPLTDFMAGAGLDGFLAMGTTGEGLLLSLHERKRVIDLFVAASRRRLKVVAHAGAQTTRETVRLAEHAAQSGADGVAVIGPPYFALDDMAMFEHFAAAGRACAPVPFYIYEFAARSGYSVPLHVIKRLRDQLPNLAGLKVSDSPWANFEPYLIDGLSVFVGPEALIHRGLAGGAVGAVSALAAALPELVINAVRTGRPESSERCMIARDVIQRFPFHAALKTILGVRGIAMSNAVRAPLRGVTPNERAELELAVADLLKTATATAP